SGRQSAGVLDPAPTLRDLLDGREAGPQDGDETWSRAFTDACTGADRPDRILVAFDAPAFDGTAFDGTALDSTAEQAGADSPPIAARRRTRQLLGVVQALAGLSGPPPRLVTLTRGAQTLAAGSPPGLVPGGVRGLLRVLALEHPELRTMHIDADPGSTDDAAGIVDELLADGSDEEVALRAGVRFVARIVPAPPTAAERRAAGRQEVEYGRDAIALRAPSGGSLDDLDPVAVARRTPGPGQVEVRVQAAGMNFRDVLIALGALPHGPIGFECAGVVTAVGPGVTSPSPGQEVLAVDLTGGGAFGTFLTTGAEFTMPVPVGVDPVRAAGIPVAFLTAWYALHDLAGLRAGERVLVHAGTGGTGLAAIAVARMLGAEVLATAGSPEKRAYLRGMGIDQVMDSRRLDFAEQTRAATGGRGVDVVLNSLAGEAIRAGLDCLAPFGRFVELGLRDILADNPLGLLPFRNSITMASVNILDLCRNRPERVAVILREVSAAFDAGRLTPPPVTTYPLAQATEAFRFMAGARHIGKVVLTVPAEGRTTAALSGGVRPPVRTDGSYLITGGLRGVGLETAAWLASRGAGRLVLNGRSAPTPQVEERLARLAAAGADIQVVLGDAAEAETTDRLVAAATADGLALRGIVHSAMVLADAVISGITDEQVERVWRPKAEAAWRLHEATADRPLDWFVLYSSMSSLLGNPGQGAYAAANSWLDSFADWRSEQGLPTTAINWGPWGEVGAATDFAGRGYDTISTAQGLHALETVLLHRRRHAAVLPGTPATWIPAAGRDAALFRGLVRAETDTRQADAVPPNPGQAKAEPPAARPGGRPVGDGNGNGAGDGHGGGGGDGHDGRADGSTDVLAAIRGSAPGLARRETFESYLADHLRTVLRLGSSAIDPDTPLRSLGFDSLLALELRSRLEPALGISLPGNFVWKYATLAALADGLAERAALPLE
ncbi:SDR family NAD(P)-dependent oxidoreductase, partial [Frankia sp. AiPs1]|uniref:SDR family NAD(P)-dependent oxidoreductase n=1 Tax=Frankia sp. AiPs1 TaxID=573493 RepID=UPI0020438B7C